ncbi:hypothetical protein JOC55_005745 [Paenibacillus sacheonensis]|nr:hypothetical protein [Paenibacillus sacheonensis]
MTTLAVGGTAVYAQVNQGQGNPVIGHKKFTQVEARYYLNLMADVLAGKLPASEMSKARDFILAHPKAHQSIIERYHIK